MARLIRLIGMLAIVSCTVGAAARIGIDGPNGFRIDLNATFQPGGDQLPSAIADGREGRVHRFVLDRGQQRYFAYDLVMVASGTDSLRVRVEALSLSAAEVANIVDPGMVAIPLHKPQLIPDVKAGHRLVLELNPNPTVGQRVVDTLVFTRPAKASAAASN